ncbi:hypothetical protein L873DRAFT_1821649 [Choiromyces venosus 120613-1]|uniref:Uncharacterized protein n=1 Tax=Choiromyces venosus 120613-1 TaxID=1336337 RepID=A0A3N4J0S1_9PEZI|nr:hypothetical protein L873DRAFT_1821649 [Choiromyces venosus 120613-1]
MCNLTGIVYACNHTTYLRSYTCPRALNSRLIVHPTCMSFVPVRADFTPPRGAITQWVFIYDKTCGRRELGCQFRMLSSCF